MFAIATREEGRMNQEILRFDKLMVKMRDIRNNFEVKKSYATVVFVI